MSLRRIMLLARKETWHILRDMRTVYMALGMPLVMLLLFGYALTMDVDNIGLEIVDYDRTPSSRALISAIHNTGAFEIVGRPDNASGLLADFRTGRAVAALVIPAEYERRLERGERVTVQLIADGTNANDASIAIGYGVATGQALSLEKAKAALERLGVAKGQMHPPIRVELRNRFNQDLRSQWYLVPGLIALILALTNTILIALTVAREWESGTMEQLLVTPVKRIEIILGKLIPFYFIGLGQLALIASCGVLLFEVPLRGSIFLLFLASSIFILVSLAHGLLASIVTRHQLLAMQVAVLTSLLPSTFLSGFMSPIASMPTIIQYISYIIPARHFLFILRGLFLKDATLQAIAPQMIYLSIFAAFLCVMSVAAFKTRMD